MKTFSWKYLLNPYMTEPTCACNSCAVRFSTSAFSTVRLHDACERHISIEPQQPRARCKVSVRIIMNLPDGVRGTCAYKCRRSVSQVYRSPLPAVRHRRSHDKGLAEGCEIGSSVRVLCGMGGIVYKDVTREVFLVYVRLYVHVCLFACMCTCEYLYVYACEKIENRKKPESLRTCVYE